jgi:hypothetical protein
MQRLAIVMTMAACRSAPSDVVSNQELPRAETLGAELTRAIGGGESVAILPTGKGLVAMSSDGGRQRVLADGKVVWAIVDPRSEVIWFELQGGSELLAIDLEAPASAKPRIVHAVTALPGAEVTIDYPEPKTALPDDVPPGAMEFGSMSGYGPSQWPSSQHVVINISPEPALTFRESTVFGTEDANRQGKEATQRAKIADRAFLVELAHRPKHDHGAKPSDAPRVAIDVVRCGAAGEDCGKAQKIPGTKYERVIVESACGDSGCHRMFRLYDPATKTYLGPEKAKRARDEWGYALANAWVAPDGQAFVSEGRLVRFDRGIVFDPSDGDNYFPEGGGWLGAVVYVDYY